MNEADIDVPDTPLARELRALLRGSTIGNGDGGEIAMWSTHAAAFDAVSGRRVAVETGEERGIESLRILEVG